MSQLYGPTPTERSKPPGYLRSLRQFKREARKRYRLARVLRRLFWAAMAFLALVIAMGIVGSVSDHGPQGGRTMISKTAP